MMLLAALWEALFPRKCVFCGGFLTREETDLCARCRKDAPALPPHRRRLRYIEAWTAPFCYEEPVRGSILRYKFGGRRSYAGAYGRLVAMAVSRDLDCRPELLVPVPLSRRRRFRRGYDQTALLAEAVSRDLGIPVVRALKKIRHNPAQSGLREAAARQANVLGAYAVRDAGAIRGRRVLLLDDVITTGATAGECARVLLTAGADAVCCAALAARRE